MDLTEAAIQLQGLDHGDLTSRLAALESFFHGQDSVSADALCDANGISEPMLEAAFVLKEAAGQINVVIHAVGILASLPHILESGETVESLSLGAGNTGRQFDLETTHRVAEFKFIQWRGGAESIRQNSLFKDFFYLAEAEIAKRRCLYLLELDRPLRFLNGRRALSSILTKEQRLRDDFRAVYGDRFSVARDYYDHRRDLVDLYDLTQLVPAFAKLARGLTPRGAIQQAQQTDSRVAAAADPKN